MQEHWEKIYSTKSLDEVSWTRPHLDSSLEIIDSLDLSLDASIIDVGSGASSLADDLVERGFRNITLLDISKSALDHARTRLGERSQSIDFIDADIRTSFFPPNKFDLWHDRAVFHFLTDGSDRDSYVERLTTGLRPGGNVVIATFANDGPLKCSGVDVRRYDENTLAETLGSEFTLIHSFREQHLTPFETTQNFLYTHFRKTE